MRTALITFALLGTFIGCVDSTIRAIKTPPPPGPHGTVVIGAASNTTAAVVTDQFGRGPVRLEAVLWQRGLMYFAVPHSRDPWSTHVVLDARRVQVTVEFALVNNNGDAICDRLYLALPYGNERACVGRVCGATYWFDESTELIANGGRYCADSFARR